MSETTSKKTAEEKAKEAQRAALELSNVADDERRSALRGIADEIESKREEILEANRRDVERAEELLEEGKYTQALVDRLKLDEEKVEGI
ncbi:MAG: gamma-glutamyl-phosphate reductase, partial [Halobacteria archaeon]|nr:gamma-glutamyl-phosphate reductase [Halobacteria archaeon]